MISDEELLLPFAVEGSNEPDPAKAKHDQNFATRGEALEAFHRLGYRYKFLSEIGEYKDKNGRLRRSWMYYYWNQNPAWGKPPEQGYGYDVLEDDIRRAYTPVKG